MPPPRYQPKPTDLGLRWFADPFDKRMRVQGPLGTLIHTPIGTCLEVLVWIRENNKSSDPTWLPVEALLIEVLDAFYPEWKSDDAFTDTNKTRE